MVDNLLNPRTQCNGILNGMGKSYDFCVFSPEVMHPLLASTVPGGCLYTGEDEEKKSENDIKGWKPCERLGALST